MTGREAVAIDPLDQTWSDGPSEIVIGKDILELLSSSMYVDPITIYREYVQNAVDAIDEARRDRKLKVDEIGRVDIVIDASARSIRLRDNGTGLRWSHFERRLLAFGNSGKRGTSARGFRGVGRLSGLGYCQELVFRSRGDGESRVSECRWDCRALKSALRSVEFGGDLAELVRKVVSVRQVDGADWPARFFEVELNGVVRHRNDRLLNASIVSEYLSQVAPVPFFHDFTFGSQIVAALSPFVQMGDVYITVSDENTTVVRPQRNSIETDGGTADLVTELELKELPGLDGGTAAIAWILHHGYSGAIPSKNSVKGLRLRSGNVQVGDHTLLEHLFPEPRFNAWSIGEVHIIDKRILPNGRRDHFEQSVHFDNLLNNVAPITRDIARRCRLSSVRRKWLRDFDLHETAAGEKIAIIKQGGLGRTARASSIRDVNHSIDAMTKIATIKDLAPESNQKLEKTVATLRRKVSQISQESKPASPLSHLPPKKRLMYEHLIDLIYECSANRVAAKALVDRIIGKVRKI